jgi:hypothetical protein
MVVLVILRGHKFSLQNALNKLFSAVRQVFSVPTASALCQARQKLRPEIFQYLTESVSSDFYELYEEEGLVQRWHGRRLLACDGTYLNLPDNSETRREFFLQTNQHKGAEAVQALSCILYDLLNELVLEASLGTREQESRPLLEELWGKTAPSDILILDRHYANYRVLATAAAGSDLVVRLPSNRFKEAQPHFRRRRFRQPQYDELVEIKCPASARRYVREEGLAEKVRVRLISFRLERGEVEVLATTLLDRERYPAREFKWLYGRRWGEESFINRIKNIFDAERFSGTTPLVVRQDYYGVLFLATLESILGASDREQMLIDAEEAAEKKGERWAEEELSEQQQLWRPKINHCVSYAALLERLVELLLSNRSTEKVLEEMHHLFRTSPTRARPGRHYPRSKEKNRRAQRLRYHKYVKKIVA